MTNSLDTFAVEPVHPHIGAEIRGVDLTRPIDDALFALIRDAFNQHSVLVFRDQDIDDDQQVAFSSRFGELEKNSFVMASGNRYVYHLSNIDEHGEVLAADASKRTFLKVNSRWHTDSSFKPIPAMASILSGREIPQHERADTEFASMRVGYATLPAERREQLHGLIGVHYYGYSLSLFGDETIEKPQVDALPPVRQPLVRVHPGSGDPSLFVSGHIESIEGMPHLEGRKLAEELVAWCTRPGFVYAHEWRTNDLVMWDNRCALHRASVIPAREIRRAHRTTVAGEGPIEALASA
jgi:alpha-ketoglutarate-dependent 2,4-dichlorophenoxyacetate dioxygenase